MPLDPEYPVERLRYMIEDAQVGIVLAQKKLMERLPVSGEVAVVDLEGEWRSQGEQGEENLPPVTQPNNLAYIIYTSGSTGRPKGVGVEHGNIVRLVKETDYVVMDEKEVFLQLAPVSFDASTFEIWGSLGNGARLEIISAGRPTLEELRRTVEERGITTLWLTTGLFHQVVEGEVERLRGVRQLLAGGEVLSAEQVKRAGEKLEETRIINFYGPTEGTTFSCCYGMNREQVRRLGEHVPIGVPITNTRMYVLDEGMEAVPVGVVGELYIGGAGVARGYWGQAGMTAEKFVPDRFSQREGERLYRTGDRVRWREHGNLEFVGRKDEQVKMRGYRIELGEIEVVLQQQAGVEQCVVVMREEEGAGTAGGLHSRGHSRSGNRSGRRSRNRNRAGRGEVKAVSAAVSARVHDTGADSSAGAAAADSQREDRSAEPAGAGGAFNLGRREKHRVRRWKRSWPASGRRC